ncbi:MAG: hypothetical protein OEZ01_09410, partial [Candidatus Heimdallarchaeota archaeon]|nr:hypothetical protein [Candidatus Heimdallarchaeota archaeon]
MKKNRKVILIFLGNFAGSTASLLLEQILKDTEQEDIFFTNPPLLPIVIHQDPFLQKELLKDFSSFVKTNWFVQLEEKLTYISDGEEFQFLHHIIEEEYKGKDVLFSIMFSPISEYDTLKLNSLFRFINTNYPESNRLLISLKPSTSSAGPTAPYYELVTLYLALHHSNALLLWDEDAISNV